MAKQAGIGMWMVAIAMACPWSVRAAGDAELRMQAGTTVHAVLETKLDARSAKVGDSVKARASRALKSGETVLLPRGSKLLGRVSMVQAGADASAHGESRLGVSFDRAVLPDGTELAVDLAIQAIAAPEEEPARTSRALETSPSARSTPRTSRGVLAQATGEVLGDAADHDIGIANDTAISADADLGRGINVDGTLSTSSEGVIGMKGLQLDSTGKSSVLVRAGGPVTLASGTRMLLRAKGEASAH